MQVRNVHFETTDKNIVIHYDLIGNPDKKYKVQVTLKNEEFITFNYRPLNTSGDVGEQVPSGENKMIIWDIGKEFPAGLEGESYYFVVDAEYVSGSIGTWLLIAGAAVLGGGAALLLRSNKTETAPPITSELPDPIGRPNH